MNGQENHTVAAAIYVQWPAATDEKHTHARIIYNPWDTRAHLIVEVGQFRPVPHMYPLFYPDAEATRMFAFEQHPELRKLYDGCGWNLERLALFVRRIAVPVPG
jgi:hypothetical protein